MAYGCCVALVVNCIDAAAAGVRDAAALKACTWICQVVDEQPRDDERQRIMSFDLDPVLSAPWRRLVRVDGVRPNATSADITRACAAFGKIVSVYEKMQVWLYCQ